MAHIVELGYWIDEAAEEGWRHLNKVWDAQLDALQFEGIDHASPKWAERTHRMRERRAKYIQEFYIIPGKQHDTERMGDGVA